MAEADRNKLIVIKGQCKSVLTRLEKFIQQEINYTLEDLNIRKSTLQAIYSKFQETAVNLSLLGVEETEEEETENRYFNLCAALDRQINKLQSSSEPQQNGTHKAKMPSLDIPTFDGKNISNYKPFMEMFQAVVHADKRLSNVEKLCFLKKYLKGEPLTLIDALPIIGQSYESALSMLEKRYDNPALIVTNHVSHLLDMSNIQRSTPQLLREFVAQVRQHVTALEHLNQPVAEWSVLLSCILLRKLDSLTVRLFHSERVDATKIVTTEELLNFVDKRAASMEASPSVSSVSKNNSVTLVATGTTFNCLLCSMSHRLYKCPKFLSMSSEKRNEFVQENNLCRICLNFHDSKCHYNIKCSICKSSSHNKLIHISEDIQLSKMSSNSEYATHVNLHISQPIAGYNLLPTAKVLVTGRNNKRFVVRALLDCGSQTSFCTSALARKLGLPMFDMIKNISTLGDTYNNISNKGIHLSLESLVNNFKLNITCSVINKITSKLPQRQIDLSNFVIPQHVTLADSEFHIPSEISLLLGSDSFFKIMLDGKIEGGPTDPILLNTHFGYIMSSPNLANSTTISMHTVDNTFEVNNPLKVDVNAINPSNSYAIALQRLYNLEEGFAKDQTYFNLYKEFIQEYLNLRHARVTNTSDYYDPKDQPLFLKLLVTN